MTMRRLCLGIVMVALAVPLPAAAQGPRTAANGPGGIAPDQNQDQPIQIEAATLEVHDKDKMATFSGDVQVVQGDTTIKCQSLVVFYGAERGPAGQTVAVTTPPTPAARPGAGPAPGKTIVPQGAHDIRRIEARGGVTVISKDQNASGDFGVYDLRKKTITLTGNVVVSQGKNVLHGDRVVVDTVTGNAHFDSNTASPSRVRALIQPGKGPNGGPSNMMTIGPNRAN
jgi:lipopolysaccharide export system protein LptA